MKKLFVALMLLMSIGAQAQINRPKLVVGLVVDQMRWDYLYYYYDKFGEGGLKRLVDEGMSYENCMIPYVPTVTAIGHTSIYTGTTPALHGIAGNNFYENGVEKYCCGDETVQSVGSKSKQGQMSPRNNLASTIGDELKIATDFKSKVIGVALKDRAAILPAGHSADAAYWWDSSVGHFVTSTFYMNELPDWVKAFNKKNNTKPKFDIKTSNLGVDMTFRMAIAALENEQMGQDDITDLLAVSISSTDAIGHTFSTRGPENEGVYMELDKDLANFFKVLDEKVGKGNYLMFLSADHGGAHNPNFMKEHRIPAGGFETWNLAKVLDKELQAKFGVSQSLVTGTNAFHVYLNHENIENLKLDLDEVKAFACKWLEKQDEVMYAVDYEKALVTSIPQPIRERIVNGYNKRRSGDIMIISEPGWLEAKNDPNYKGTGHSQWNPYDSHIPFVLYGWNVKHGQSNKAVRMIDIAPTICAMLHIQMPNACIGSAIE